MVKIVSKVLLCTLFVAPFFAQAAEVPKEKEVAIGVSQALIPGGFDSTSDVYAVVSGVFQNGCYRWKRFEVDSDRASNVHEVHTYAAVSQGMCIMVLVPYSREINLGVLGAGEHRIRFMSGDGTYMEKVIHIEE